ncbi:PTS lactose/cellobiose transporter subunit IIA [Serratia ficaria]|uniref:N,N'-diacetylchitobiose-specific phosphotransferase enzyme IIA component n=1 Tax=Serratia ficaria TaxID=61651 RepID=A0A240BVK7_SERFI|nr:MULTISPECIES: PTS lactose/cellobiose transporter subunit IIA [Serratia]MEE4484154.1 PTS lactose/cellobiose transporter subunit IIA [Serratia ficaria]REF45323.1 PTS system cellobiose-specific IIA component [Serratia ficaria]CAI0699379.1 N,N'-diacetylchitobiose-specific phosphotransferase enzyme IIA component [Serratia ficaria]CAI0840521.1 N,N'-diacetylchitobiose-specific phosphotransferase enzyme IIA component [Serratia ficaria]CAI0882370.1 N,N'-diacetylchitobiose-specific phosphotransferase
MDLETSVMELLVQAGSARSALLAGLQQARGGDFNAAEASLAEARAAIGRAHGMQTALIGIDQGAGKIPLSLIVVHAQDHLMNAMLIQDLATDMIELYRRSTSGANHD